jgi:hypothetical protein
MHMNHQHHLKNFYDLGGFRFPERQYSLIGILLSRLTHECTDALYTSVLICVCQFSSQHE